MILTDSSKSPFESGVLYPAFGVTNLGGKKIILVLFLRLQFYYKLSPDLIHTSNKLGWSIPARGNRTTSPALLQGTRELNSVAFVLVAQCL